MHWSGRCNTCYRCATNNSIIVLKSLKHNYVYVAHLGTRRRKTLYYCMMQYFRPCIDSRRNRGSLSDGRHCNSRHGCNRRSLQPTGNCIHRSCSRCKSFLAFLSICRPRRHLGKIRKIDVIVTVQLCSLCEGNCTYLCISFGRYVSCIRMSTWTPNTPRCSCM